MFDKICIELNSPIDIGMIAEYLLFYKRVILVIGYNRVYDLKEKHLETIIELIKLEKLEIHIRTNYIGVKTRAFTSSYRAHDVVLGKEEKYPDLLFKKTNNNKLNWNIDNRSHVAKELINYLKPLSLDKDIEDFVRVDLMENEYISYFINEFIKQYKPQYNTDNLQFEFVKHENGFAFETNIDFNRLNKELTDSDSYRIIDTGSIVHYIHQARERMYLSAKFSSEICTDNVSTSLIKKRVNDIFSKTTRSKNNIESFNDFILDDAFAISKYINNNEDKFNDLLKVVEKSERFKEWLTNLDSDNDLIREYHKAVTKETWIDKLPNKSIRWAIFTGGGIMIDSLLTGGLATTIGVTLSAADGLCLDYLIKGWKPNIFIENELANFIEK